MACHVREAYNGRDLDKILLNDIETRKYSSSVAHWGGGQNVLSTIALFSDVNAR